LRSKGSGLFVIDREGHRIYDHLIGFACLFDADKLVDYGPAYFFGIALRRIAYAGAAAAELADDIARLQFIKPVSANLTLFRATV
jgi:hypothetical protein